jgi:putative salt-induced outer membrane protein
LAATSGNSTSHAFLVNADVARITAADKISLGGYVNEGSSKVGGVTTTTSGKEGVNGRYDYNLSPKMFAFGGLGFDHDRVQDITLRSLISAGIGSHIIKTETKSFDVFGGVSFTDTRYNIEQTISGETKKDFHSLGLLLGEESTQQVSEAVLFKQRLEYYAGMTGSKAQLVKFTGALNVAMNKTISLSVGVIDTYNSKVGVGVKKNDVSLFTGISMKLGG